MNIIRNYEVQSMNSTFLAESKDTKIEFDYFEIEKIDSEHVFLVNISSTFTDFIDVKVSKVKRALFLKLKVSIHKMNLQPHVIQEKLVFKLPPYVEIDGYYLNKNGTNIFLIFYKNNI